MKKEPEIIRFSKRNLYFCYLCRFFPKDFVILQMHSPVWQRCPLRKATGRRPVVGNGMEPMGGALHIRRRYVALFLDFETSTIEK
jgi:hypothetical protein